MITKDTPITCPVGETHCDYLSELPQLRQQNTDLLEQVRTDTLTGIFNFRFFIQSLELEMERTRRSGQPTTLIMFDLDHFKQVNDSWGHDFGNTALVQTATSLQKAVRKLDIPCRYGGEEFAVILPSTNLLIGIRVADRIRKMIASTPLQQGEKDVNLTVSAGVDVFLASQNETPEEFTKRTDQYLYTAKREGRNCVRHAATGLAKDKRNVSQDEKDALYKTFNNSSSL